MADEFRRMRQLTGTPEEWAYSTLVIGDAEIAVERTGSNSRIKLGDGFSIYSQLPYLDTGAGSGAGITLNTLAKGNGIGGLINSLLVDDGTTVVTNGDAIINGDLVVDSASNFTGTVTANSIVKDTPAFGTNTDEVATTAFVQAAVADVLADGSAIFVSRAGDTMTGALNISAGGITVAAGGAHITGDSQFINTVQGPTAAPGTNNTQLATTAFVQAAVGGSGSFFVARSGDTMTGPLNVNSTEGITTQLVTADVIIANNSISCAIFEVNGFATAPTPDPGTNDDQIATTAFVVAAVAAGGGGGGGIPDAPADDKIYGRKNATWTEVPTGGGGGTYVLKAGDTMTGALVINHASGLTTPVVTSEFINNSAEITTMDFTALGSAQCQTAAPGTNTDEIATTAFVTAAVAAGGGGGGSSLPPSTMAQFDTACTDGNFVYQNQAALLASVNCLGTGTFSGILNVASTTNNVTVGTTTGSLQISPAQTTGTITVGSLTGTGLIQLGISNANQQIWIGTGPTLSGNSKTIQIGTGGVSGSFTTVNIGPSTAGASGGVVLNGSVTASGAINIAATTNNITFGTTTGQMSIGTAQTTGAIFIGSSAGTGGITVGLSTGNQTVGIGTGATVSGSTKNINIGTAGVSGSTTNITYGSAVVGATTTHVFNGNVGVGTNTPASKLHVNDGYFTSSGYGATPGALSMLYAKGTAAAPTVVNTASALGYISGSGYDGTTWREAASMVFASEGAISSTSAAGAIAFNTAPAGSIVQVERMRINSGGTVLFTGAAVTTFTPDIYTANFGGTSAYNSGSAGAGVAFSGKYNAAGATADLAFVSGIKENTTDGDYGGALIFGTRATGSGATSMEKMRIRSNGNVEFLGGIFPSQGVFVQSVANGGAHLNPGTPTDSGYIRFVKNGGTVSCGYIGFVSQAAGGGINYQNETGGPHIFNNGLTATPDGTPSCGQPAGRWSSVFAVNGTIQTSDEREKNWIGPAAEPAIRAAGRIIDELGFFTWLAGADDQIHYGVRAQQVLRILMEEGLEETQEIDFPKDAFVADPPVFRHAFVTFSTWEEQVHEYPPALDGEAREPTITPAGNHFGMNLAELGLFVATAQQARMNSIEARLAAAGL